MPISTVRNKLNEQWALVEKTDVVKFRNNYGFVKVDYLEKLDVNFRNLSELKIPESIEGIYIGDLLEKAIGKLGIDYVETRLFERGLIHYGETIGTGEMMVLGDGIDILYNVYTHLITSIRVSGEGYKTADGYGVGSNAIEAINFYKNKYPLVEDEGVEKGPDIWNFDIGNDYALKIYIDTQELKEDSVIRKIKLEYSRMLG